MTKLPKVTDRIRRTAPERSSPEAAVRPPATASPPPFLPASPRLCRTPRHAAPSRTHRSHQTTPRAGPPASHPPRRRGCARPPGVVQPIPVPHRMPAATRRAARQTYHGRRRRRRSQEIAQPAHRDHVLLVAGYRLTQSLGRFLTVRFDAGRPRREPQAQRLLAGVEDGTRAARLYCSHEVGVEVGRRAGGQTATQRPQVAGCSQFATSADSAARCSGPMVGPGSLILV